MNETKRELIFLFTLHSLYPNLVASGIIQDYCLPCRFVKFSVRLNALNSQCEA